VFLINGKRIQISFQKDPFAIKNVKLTNILITTLVNVRFFLSQVGMFWDSAEGIRVLRFVNKACDNHALALLSICYLPGVLAAYIQVAPN
jgi:hypothetical protein